MPEDGPHRHRDRCEELRVRLGQPSAASDREALKADIITLYKDVERELAELSAVRERVKALVELWKVLEPARRNSGGDAARMLAPTLAPTPHAAAAPPHGGDRPVVSDHIGASTFVEKGWTLISLGDYEAAERALLRAVELSPGDPQTESLLGWARMHQEKHDEALVNFQQVLSRQPANSLARINLGYICLKKRIFGEAIEHLSRAIRLDNDRKATLYAHFYLGLVYLEREMYDDAQTFLRKTLALGPNLIEAHYELGRALWFDEKREEAIQAWRDGLAANKFNPWGKRCGEMLAHVEGGGAPSRT